MDNAAIDLQHQFYDMLMQSQYWSAERMRDYQRGQLAQLLRHAKKNVPFYENRLDAVLKPNGDIDWDRWGEIPIVKRTDMLQHREAMQARELPPGHGAVGFAESSGSTGKAITISTNALVVLAAYVNYWRSGAWQGLDWSRRHYTRRHKNVPTLANQPTGTSVGIWGPPWDSDARRGEGRDVGGDSPPEDVVRFLAENEPGYLSTGPKTIQILALESERLGQTASIIAGLAHGERVGSPERGDVRRILGGPIFDRYSSKESAQIAHPCELNAGLHVNAESVLVEILDEDGRPCPAGVPGRVIVTPFVSTAQPLIRYEQGDIAVLGDGCSCGRSLPVLTEIIGRQSAVFSHPDGRRVHRFYPNEARSLLDCTMWQIAQIGPLEFEIRYVPRDMAAYGDENAAADMFRAAYFEDAQLVFRRIERLRATPADKYLEYVNEMSR